MPAPTLPPAKTTPAPQVTPAKPVLARSPEPRVEAVKVENSRLAKALEELSALDLDVPPSPAKPVVAVQPKVEAKHPAHKGPLYISVTSFEAILADLHTLDSSLSTLQTKNERLGMVEAHTKAQLDTLANHFEYVQRHLLIIDEKLFKVN
jgi:hypothetical protein